jgi:hypothetical protein
MLKVDGQFQINLTVAGSGQLGVSSPDLRELELIEVAGVGLPMVKGVVVCTDYEARALFHEGNKLTISYGVGNGEKDDIIDTQFFMTRVTVSRTNSQYNIAFVGVYDAMSYLVEHKQRSFKDLSAVEAIVKVAKDHFAPQLVDSNVEKSNDRMTWLQAAIPDKSFIAATWMHADLPKSFPMIGISADGHFRLRDLATLISSDGANPAWQFFPDLKEDETDETKQWYHGDYHIDNNSGFMNHWLGYGNTLDIRDVELGEYEEVLEHTAPQLAKASEFPRNADADGRRGTPQPLNDNEYPRYWHSYQQNTTQLALYSTVTVKLSFDDKLHKEMRVLDLVYFAEANNKQDQFDNPFTGLYIISKLSRKFTAKQIITTVQLSRETLTDIKGDVR